jgi:hypothetical protein
MGPNGNKRAVGMKRISGCYFVSGVIIGTIEMGRGQNSGPVEFMVSLLDTVVAGQEVITGSTYQQPLDPLFQ